MKRIGILGASGRVGRLLVERVLLEPDFVLAAALVSSGSDCLDQVCVDAAGKQEQVYYSSNMQNALEGCDAFVDFSTALSGVELAQLCAEGARPLVVASTGHSPEQLAQLRKCAERTALLYAPNTSIGAFVTQEIASLAARLLGADYDIEVLEMHHKNKKDAPSGTALKVASLLAEQGDLSVTPFRDARHIRGAGELGVSSLRGGDVAGEHTLYFLGEGERLEIVHRVTDRGIFANGAIELLKRLIERDAGYYSVPDLYNL